MKKFFLVTIALFLFVHIGSAFAQQEFVPLAPIPGLTGEGDITTSEGLPAFFNNLYTYLIGLAAIIAIIQIIRSGIELALNQGSVSEIMSAKGRVAQSIFGLVLVLTPALVFGIINPNILNLSVTLTPITFKSPQNTSQPVSPEGCVTLISNQYFTRARCPNNNAATSFTCPNNQRHNMEFCRDGNSANDCPATVTCSRQESITGYRFYEKEGTRIAPSSVATQTAFKNACASVGGEVEMDEPTILNLAMFRNLPDCSTYGIDVGESPSGVKKCFLIELSCDYQLL